MSQIETKPHPFEAAPNRTIVSLAVPVLFSLVAEPLTALVDTAFVARLGANALASLGVGATLLSSVFWIFNFLGIGVQTAVAQATGRSDSEEVARVSTLAFLLAGLAGLGLIVLGVLATPSIVFLMGASGDLGSLASSYMYIRWFGAPAVLAAVAAFGVLRGCLDMKTPLWIAIGINALNLGLDPILIFGLGPVPAYGIRGAALASTISQWFGALWLLQIVLSRVGFERRLQLGEVKNLLKVGGDLFVRTGLLNLFLILATRTATMSGAEAGAAHQAIRQFWVFTALLLDAFAISAQSLVGYFLGSSVPAQARRVAAYAVLWSLGTGAFLGLAMIGSQRIIASFLVPSSSLTFFFPAWWVAALSQPINAISFATDGIHWGTGDFKFLRNVVLGVSLIGFVGLGLIDSSQPSALTWIWVVTAIWIGIRGALGLARIWPGIGKAPLSESDKGCLAAGKTP